MIIVHVVPSDSDSLHASSALPNNLTFVVVEQWSRLLMVFHEINNGKSLFGTHNCANFAQTVLLA